MGGKGRGQFERSGSAAKKVLGGKTVRANVLVTKGVRERVKREGRGKWAILAAEGRKSWGKMRTLSLKQTTGRFYARCRKVWGGLESGRC